MRRKGVGIAGVKSWIVVSETGEAHLENVGKHSIMRRSGLPARDLRVLDPMLSHPSSILGRERAIVVNLEHIKAIITATQVHLINSSNPFFQRFLQHLLTLLPNSPNHQTPSTMSNEMDGGCEEKTVMKVSASLHGSDAFPETPNKIETRVDNPKISSETAKVTPSPTQLPFEFRALEACIESACRCFESETSRLEEEAYPALDELTSQLSTLNLERVRQIKSRLVALSGRVQKVADELENLLDDNNDMAEMYLTQKLNARLLVQTSSKEGDELDSEKLDKFLAPKLDVEELEMLLEAYFVQTNGISQKLSSLSEYVDDTEDYINITLDDKRNQLLQVAIIFNTLNMIVSAGIVVVGLFGMNIQTELFDGQSHQFLATTGGTFGGCILVFLVCFWWEKKRYLLSQ